MIRLIPYTKQLIPIGNAHHYEGQLVWSDGNVAYGWEYAPQPTQSPVASTPDGFWVGEEDVGKYKLAKKNLHLGSNVVSREHGDLQCYPCYVDVQDTGGNLPEYGVLYSPNGIYLYNGAVISLDASGNVLTYENYLLRFYTNRNVQRQDGNNHPLYYAHVVISDYSIDDWYYVAIYSNNNNNYYILYDYNMLKIAEITEQNDTFSIVYNYDGRNITGTCDFKIVKKYVLLDVIVTTVDLYSLYAMGGTVLYNSILAVDAIRLGVDGTTVRAAITQYERGDYVSKLFQLATAVETYFCAYSPDRDVDGDVMYTGDYKAVYDMLIGSGTCTLTVTSTGVTIYDVQTGTEIAHTSGDLLTVGGTYVGHGRITYDNYNSGEWDYELWLYIDGMTGTADIEYNGSYCVVTNHSTGNKIAEETAQGLDVYYNGVVNWQGPGSITVQNTTVIEYSGNYLVASDIRGSSNQITSPLADPTVTDGTLYAEQNGNHITVTDNGNPVYDGEGSITINNAQPAAGGMYSGDYIISIHMSGTGIIEPQSYSSGMNVYDSNHNIVASLAYGYVDIYDNTGTVTYSGAGTITTNNLVPIKWFGGYTINAAVSGTDTVVIKDKEQMCDYDITYGYSGHSYRIEQPTGDTVVYYTDKIATYDRTNGTVRIVDSHQQLYNGAGSISVSNTSLVSGVYEGDYSIALYKDGTGIVNKDINDNKFIYDLNNNLVAREKDREIIVYSGGSVVYQGTGTISLSNTVKTSDTVVVYDSSNQLIAEENNEDIDVYDANHQLIYSGPGWIQTNNLSVNRSNKKYHIDASNGLQQVQQYPSYWQAGDDVKVDLSDMDLLVTTQQGTDTYTGDVLGLLSTQGFIFVHGVHSWKDYVISQDSNLIWHNRQSETYIGIQKCFSLAWLKRKWKV